MLRVRTETDDTAGFCRNKMDCQHNVSLLLFKRTKFPEGIVYSWSTEIRHHCLVVSMHILNNSNTLIV